MGKKLFRYFVLVILVAALGGTMVSVVAPTPAKAAGTVYIDPSYDGQTRNGSFSNPYKYWTEAMPLAAGTEYLQKRGTQADIDMSIVINQDGITIGAYGTGEKPFIYSLVPPDGHAIKVDDCAGATVQDLRVEAPLADSCIKVQGPADGGHTIQRCDFSGSIWGIRCMNSMEEGVVISNCEVHHTRDDGFFGHTTNNVEIKNCYFHDVNLNYVYNGHNEQQAGGDCIQFFNTQNTYIHHNILDHSSMGNKLDIILHADTGNPSHNNRIEYNHLIGGGPTTSNIYLSREISAIIRHNIMENALGYVEHAPNVGSWWSAQWLFENAD